MPELKLYTVKDLRDWLENNHPADGLSERVIAPTRAWAIIHNPYVRDDDAIVAAIFEDGQLAAYTASFPDMLDGKRVWWASTLYCYPKFTGKGYGLIVVGSLMEAHEPDLTYDRWAASETVEIFNHFGYQTTYTKRYHQTDKKIDTSSFKGKMADCVQELNKRLHPWPKMSKANYTVQFAECIDSEIYAFVKAHKGTDLWLREQDMLNWIINHPFVKGGMNETACVFGEEARVYEYKVAKVYSGDELQGVYMLRMHDEALSVLYLYYADEAREDVFASIVDKIIETKPKSFITEDKELDAYVGKRLYFPKSEEENVSLTLPEIKGEFTLQMGDGDTFA